MTRKRQRHTAGNKFLLSLTCQPQVPWLLRRFKLFRIRRIATMCGAKLQSEISKSEKTNQPSKLRSRTDSPYLHRFVPSSKNRLEAKKLGLLGKISFHETRCGHTLEYMIEAVTERLYGKSRQAGKETLSTPGEELARSTNGKSVLTLP